MGGGLGVGDVSPYVSPSPPSMYPTNSLPPFTPKPAPPPFPPPHPGPIFHPPRILIPATCPRYRRSPAWPHVWVSPPPLSLPERPHVWVRGGCTPQALHGVVGGRFLRGAVGLGCAARGVPAAVRGAAPHRSFPPAEGAPPVSGEGGTRTVGEGAVMVWGPPAARHPQGAAPSTPSPPGSATMDHPGPPSAS